MGALVHQFSARYNGVNRLTSTSDNGASYDGPGNQTVVNGDTLAYDAENRMTSAYDPIMHSTETYVYDGNGQRVQKSGPGGTTTYVYDAFGNLAAEYGAAPSAPCTTCYLSYDHLGSVRLVTDQNANVVSRHDYLPFGEEIPANTAGRNGQWGSTTDVDTKFTGQIRDTETGMDYFNARYFTDALGRFNSPDPGNAGADPTDPQTWNAYAYVRNNPLALIDPTGMADGDPTFSATATACSWWQFWCWFGGGSNGGDDSGGPGDEWLTWDPFPSGDQSGQQTMTTPPQIRESYLLPVSLLTRPPNNGNCVLQAPSGQYRIGRDSLGRQIVALFQSQMVVKLNAAFSQLNKQGTVPLITSGFRSASDQWRMRNGGSGANPAARVSWHQVGLAIDLNHNVPNFQAIVDAMTDQGLT